MLKWEYQWWDVHYDPEQDQLDVLRVNDGDILMLPSLYEMLGTAGAEGWELVSAMPSPGGREPIHLFFKRQVASESKQAAPASEQRCRACNQDRMDAAATSCTWEKERYVDGTLRLPVPYIPDRVGTRCDGCHVAAGGSHHVGCDLEICPCCTGLITQCACLPELPRVRRSA